MKLHYREASLTAILDHWAKAYESADDGEEVTQAEVAAIDVTNNKVIFKLYTESTSKS